MSSDNIDRLSHLPDEMLDLIFFYCSESAAREEGHIYIQYKYYHDHRIYREYQGDMKHGVPNGKGYMYEGRNFFAEMNNVYLKDGFQTPWIFLPLLYVYPKFESKLSLLTH